MKKYLAIFLLILSPCAWAGITIKPGAGNLPGILVREGHYHVDAFMKAIAGNREVLQNPEHMNNIRKRLLGMTYSRFEYTYTNASGNEVVKIYRSRSGRSVLGTVGDAKYVELGSSDSEGGSGLLKDDIVRDLGESHLYAHGGADEVRVTNLPHVEGSAIVARGPQSDAEFKAVRQIETDIRQGRVPSGGKLVGFVSKEPCGSCRDALRVLSADYGIDGEVVHLVETKAGEDLNGEGKLARMRRANRTYYFEPYKKYVTSNVTAKRLAEVRNRPWSDAEHLLMRQQQIVASGAIESGCD